jgi:sigma-B regulation protein RsbU (phosphoserine phosphatase)
MSAGTVLVADDQQDVLEAMRILLKSGGFAVETVASPSAVLDRTRNGNYDAVLIDLNYTRDTTSGIEGMDLLAELRTSSDVPVIIMTGWATMDIAIEALRRGANDFIQKPWDNSQVLKTIREEIAKAQQRSTTTKWEKYEREDARNIHDALLRVELPNVRSLEVAAWSKPKLQVGGDYYEACELPDGRVLFCIADVCGKGLSATIQMSNLQGAMKALAFETNPATLCRTLNRILRANLPTGRFISLFVGVLEPENGQLSYCNAGHLPPIHLRHSGRCTPLTAGGSVLGYFEDCDYEIGEVSLETGDSLVLFTDGVTEAADDQFNEFGDNVLPNVIASCIQKTAPEVRDAIVDAASRHCGLRFEDDATVLVLRRNKAA